MATGVGRAVEGYSWVARSLSLCPRPSSVFYHPRQDAAPPKRQRRRDRRRRPPRIAEEDANEHTQRFWEKTKDYFQQVRRSASQGGAKTVQVDAFELAVESPTPFKNRNCPRDAKTVVAELEQQRQELRPLPENLSIAAAIYGILEQRHGVSTPAPVQRERLTSIGEAVQLPEDALSETPAPVELIEFDEALSIRPSAKRRETLFLDPSSSGPPSAKEKENSPVQKEPFEALLEACQQGDQTLQTLPSLETLFTQRLDLNKTVKIGEGAFGEAFKCDSTVVKIVPFAGALLVCGYEQKDAEHFLPEVIISQLLSDLRRCAETTDYACPGFAMTHDTKVCTGPYPPVLIDAWEKWDDRYGTENDPVERFPREQLFVVFFIEDGGSELARFRLTAFSQIRSLLLQVVLSLAVAEGAYQFEHRDLHLGNILLSNVQTAQLSAKLEGEEIDICTEGLHVVLIDFSLARIDSGDITIFKDLSQEPEIFEGPARDPHADTYRRMRKVVKNKWRDHFPQTNCLWVQYLADVLLSGKKLSLGPSEKHELRLFKRSCMRAASCMELFRDDFFKGQWRPKSSHFLE